MRLFGRSPLLSRPANATGPAKHPRGFHGVVQEAFLLKARAREQLEEQASSSLFFVLFFFFYSDKTFLLFLRVSTCSDNEPNRNLLLFERFHGGPDRSGQHQHAECSPPERISPQPAASAVLFCDSPKESGSIRDKPERVQHSRDAARSDHSVLRALLRGQPSTVARPLAYDTGPRPPTCKAAMRPPSSHY